MHTVLYTLYVVARSLSVFFLCYLIQRIAYIDVPLGDLDIK